MEIKQLKRRGKILWFVRYGPDASHMWDAKSFTKLREDLLKTEKYDFGYCGLAGRPDYLAGRPDYLDF